jgi:hypothetical protein
MYAYEVTYEVLLKKQVAKTETVCITHRNKRTSEDFTKYIVALLEPFAEIKIIKAQEISVEECERKFGKK